ncbi:Rho GTPase activation protein [Xylariomycetidae sp. FL2044]|nr:Rho GTPase activation protein [Xylariomycetidae sp. FL2044]
MESLWVLSQKNSPVQGDEEEEEQKEEGRRARFRASETLTWMIQRSITTDCITLGSRIAKALLILVGFVREVREARSDVDGISRELHSLQSVLDLLKEDAGLFPPELAQHTPPILARCAQVVDDLDDCLSSLNSSELPKPEKRSRWLTTGRPQAARFRTTLEAHKSALGIALDLVGATAVRDMTSDVEPSKRNTIQRRQNSTETIDDISRILIEMSTLTLRLPGEFEKTEESDFNLHDYMTSLKSYAETIVRLQEGAHESEKVAVTSRQEGADDVVEAAEQPEETGENFDQGAFVGDKGLFGAYMGDTPDSAIDVRDVPVYQTLQDALAKHADENIQHIDDLMNDLGQIPSRAPTPPPKDVKRLEATRSMMVSPFEEMPDSPTIPNYGVVTQISSSGRREGRRAPPSTSKTRGFGKLFGKAKNAIVDSTSSNSGDNRPQTRSTNSTGQTDIRPSTPVIQASLVRRGSRRLSVSFKKLPMWNTELMDEEPADTGANKTNAVFGVSLQKSMQVAKGTSKTHHTGSSGSSKREFPLCMQKCCFFLKHEAVEAPDIFAEPGDAYRVAKLKEIFSRGPTYGEDVDWNHFGVYDAADVVLLYLSQLPRPLVSEALARRWVSLSRQATLSGSHAQRLDQCIDFWEEALGGLRGPARSLFKLLLNLWADVADAADRNDMTAERLAGVVLKPLMHISSEKYETDFMLSVAFLIRKRAEYTSLIRKDQSEVRRISRAAW